MATYPAPGRGAWRVTGGLLPAKPGSTSRVGYYRNAVKPQIPIGSEWLRDTVIGDARHSAYCVFLGVIAIQKLVDAEADGWFGPATAGACIRAQSAAGIEADGIVGPSSMKAFLSPMLTDLATHNAVPLFILGGLLRHESVLDPGAVGISGQDHGIAQINLGAHLDISVEQAMDVEFAARFAVEDLIQVHARWVGNTTADPWDIAIANHNSPALARTWARTGVAPVVAGRLFQIGEYVDKVKTAW